MSEKLIKFVRERDYVFVKEIGQGACGKTVLLKDDVVDDYLVCKKYSPYHPEDKEGLFQNFIREIKLLFKINHKNIVRVFNYYLYPDKYLGYILMEHVSGYDIEAFIGKNPEQINEIFEQAVIAFGYLETINILHRDIRPQNILINNEGILKVIDFGFGKNVAIEQDFDKSITLNWWCEPPGEFTRSIYDYKTEIYFIGKLFEKLIYDNGINHFKYQDTLNMMCIKNHSDRINSFGHVADVIRSDQFFEIDFADSEKECYRRFADSIHSVVSKVHSSAKYFDDIDKIKIQLDAAHRDCMLEIYVPDTRIIINCFVNGEYRYYKKKLLAVESLKGFCHLLKSITPEKQNIVVANLRARLDSIEKYCDEFDPNGDLPF